ncbi:trihelix transcription factor ASR3-like isoform X2 [Actinidia eriantha]|uniref:trihelix transcription factor ASR3-like isoform X2 n=1 Tax=Actinidia eriantha TaxID=165200 RepID=UPI00258690F8|nr:trihelix transcription factor ASR3-like isoform X2 [Actinidia eriantha]
MALERLSLGSAPVDAVPNGGDDRKSTGDDGHRAPRLPRWTRQEILVLIQGKRVAENRGRRGRTVGMAFGAGQVEPKWASVSSYCKRHGVNRGPVQCRKRWSNLAGDYKKIKEWESHIREESESFWAMRNDLRRERKLPGFFDREVYDILDGGTIPSVTPTGLALALAPSKEEVEAEAVFDSGRSAAAEDGLFSDFEQSAQEEAGGDSPGKDSPPAKEVRTTTVPDSIPISVGQNPNDSTRIGSNSSHQMTLRGGKGSRGDREARICWPMSVVR